MPVFSYVDGKLSCMYEPSHMKNAAEMLGGMPEGPRGVARRISTRSPTARTWALRFLLEPGDMMLWHNYTNLHSRTSFEDDPASPRLLLRLWLSVPNGRPADPKFKMRAQTYERIYREAHGESSELELRHLPQRVQRLRHGLVGLELRPRGGRDFAHVHVAVRIDRHAVRRDELPRRVACTRDVAEAREQRSLVVDDADARSRFGDARLTPITGPHSPM
jgi:hypothetical protein